MRVRRTVFGLAVFLFGAGIATANAESSSIAEPGGAFVLSLVLFMASAVLLGWSLVDS